MEKANKPLPGSAYPNEHEVRDFRHSNPSIATTCTHRISSTRAVHRKLSDYCGIFAEKTNKISKNVESFMQSRGLLPRRRTTDEMLPPSCLPNVPRINGDAIGNYRPQYERAEVRETRYHHYESHVTSQRDNTQINRTLSFSRTYPRSSRDSASYVHHSDEIDLRRYRRLREFAKADYNSAIDNSSRDSAGRRDPGVSKPTMRNGIDHHGARDERPYGNLYSTLPRSHRTTNNLNDRTCDFSNERHAYPKSLQDLTTLKLDDFTYPASHSRDTDYRRKDEELDDNYCRRIAGNQWEEDEMTYDDDYLRLCRNLSNLDNYPRGKRYMPGQVHYERECRTFGKDTVAFIYYKTCYL